MAKKNTIKVGNKSAQTTPQILWDELFKLYNNAKQSVGVIGGSLITIETVFKTELETTKEFKDELDGAKQTVMGYLNELDEIFKLHSVPKKVDANGKELDLEDIDVKVRVPFIGKLARTNDDIGVYMNIAVAYDGFMDKMGSSSEVLLSHLFARGNEIKTILDNKKDD